MHAGAKTHALRYRTSLRRLMKAVILYGDWRSSSASMNIGAAQRSPIPAALLLFPIFAASAQALKCSYVARAPVICALPTIQNAPQSLHARLRLTSSTQLGPSLCSSTLTPCSGAAGDETQWHERTWHAIPSGQQWSKRRRWGTIEVPAPFRPPCTSLQQNRVNFLSPEFVLVDPAQRGQHQLQTQRHICSKQIEQHMQLRDTGDFTGTVAKGLPDGKERFQLDIGQNNRQEKEPQGVLGVLRSERLLQPQKQPLSNLVQERLSNQQHSLKPQQEYQLQLQEQQTIFRRRSRRYFVKDDARWRRRILALRRNAMRRRTSREIFVESVQKQTRFAVEGNRQLREAREKEELRRLRLVDPLVRPAERRRYTVQWWPNFAREALPHVLTALRHADVLIEVRDARLPWLTQLPLHVAGNALMKPRVVVLTHADAASEIGNAHWARFFRSFYRLQAAEQLRELCRDARDSLRLPSSFASQREAVASTTPVPMSLRNGEPDGRQQKAYEKPGEHQQVLENQEMQLVPPAPPMTPVIFINAKQDGAGVVRLEKAIRRIWRRWREFTRNAEVFRRQVRQRKHIFAGTYKKQTTLTFLPPVHTASEGGDSAAAVEFIDVSSAQRDSATTTALVGTSDADRAAVTSTVIVGAAVEDAQSSPFRTADSPAPCTSPSSSSLPTTRSLTCFVGRDTTPQQEQQNGRAEEQRREEKKIDESMLKDHQRRPAELGRGELRSRRPLHLLLVGMPNVGKSALCNRLLHAKRARSYNYPGVSKTVTHYRRRGGLFDTNLHRLFDCIDSPGLLPPRESSSACRGTIIKTDDLPSSATATAKAAASSLLMNSSGLLEYSKNEQQAKKKKTLSTRGRYSLSPTAVLGMPKTTCRSSCLVHPLWTDDENIRLLAALNMLPQSCLFTIEEAAVAFLSRALHVWAKRPAYISLATMTSRYRIDPLKEGAAADENYSGCEYLHRLAEVNHCCCTGAASQRVLTDLQKGYLGRLTLEVPPTREQLTMALASLRQQQSKNPGRSSVTVPRETHKRLQPVILPLHNQRKGGGNLGAPASTDWHLSTEHPRSTEHAATQVTQSVDERVLHCREEHRHQDASGRSGGEEWDIERSAESPRVHTHAEADGTVGQKETPTPDHVSVTSGGRFLGEDDTFTCNAAYVTVSSVAEKAGRRCDSTAVSGNTSLSNYSPPNLRRADGQSGTSSGDSYIGRKKSLQSWKTPLDESPEASGNTTAELLYRRNPSFMNTKMKQTAEDEQIASRPNVLKDGREMSTCAESVDGLQPQQNEKSSNIGMDDGSRPGMHYTCNEVRTQPGEASGQTNSAHIFVWRTPLSNTDNNLVTKGGDVSLVAQKLTPATMGKDVKNCALATSAKLESWDAGAFEGW